MGKFDNPAVQLYEFKGELFKSVEQCQCFLFSEMDVQFLDSLIVIHSYGTELPEPVSYTHLTLPTKLEV